MEKKLTYLTYVLSLRWRLDWTRRPMNAAAATLSEWTISQAGEK